MPCSRFPTMILPRNYINVILFLSFLSVAQGRQFRNAQMMRDEALALTMRGLIGSRPPRCDAICRNCGRCEAIQVPIAGGIKRLQQEITRIEYSRGDDISNYKPMCWKCKCGNFIFNP